MRRSALLLVGLLALCGCEHRVRLNGGGSSFVYPVFLKWSRDYAALTGVQVDYQSTGSGNGVQQMLVHTTQFGCTDAPLTPSQRQKGESIDGEVVQVPVTMGGVVPIYHLPSLPAGTRLRFDGPTLARIFLGEIQSWNDPALAALNPQVALPADAILVVSRADPSGTTAIFADYIAKVAPALWEDKDMGPAGTAVRWPAGEAQKGNEGVAGLVRRVPGSIGYVELKYAEDVGIDFGDVKNQSGRFVRASPESVQAAAAAVLTAVPDDFAFSLTDAPGADSYPISGTVWCVFYRRQPPAVAGPLTEFLRWAVHPAKGQPTARALGYAPLPAALSAAVDARLASIAAEATSSR